MKKDYRIFVKHILECIALIKVYTANVNKEEFFASKQLQDAVIRRIEIIGEAAKNIPKSVKEKNSAIPWKKIIGMRDILVHEYFGVDLELTWKVVKKDLAELEKKVFKIKQEYNNY